MRCLSAALPRPRPLLDLSSGAYVGSQMLLVKLLLDRFDIDDLLAFAYHLHVGHIGVLFALEQGINLLESLALSLHPVVRLRASLANQDPKK